MVLLLVEKGGVWWGRKGVELWTWRYGVFMEHSGEISKRRLETWVWSSGEGSGDADLSVMSLTGEK